MAHEVYDDYLGVLCDKISIFPTLLLPKFLIYMCLIYPTFNSNFMFALNYGTIYLFDFKKKLKL
jgi:hypothetical protein